MTPKITEVQKLRLALASSMQDLKKQTVALETALKGADEPGMAVDVKKLRAAIKAAQTQLVDELDKALSESNDAKRAPLYKNAAKASDSFLTLLSRDARISALEDNPVLPVPAIAAMAKILGPLTRALA